MRGLAWRGSRRAEWVCGRNRPARGPPDSSWRGPDGGTEGRTVLWTLWERERVGRFGRMALKHIKYHV